MKIETTHTAGPWSIHWGMAQGGDGHWIVDSQDMGELSRIAMVAFHDDASGDETKQNARLIAAAPELLAALVACHDQLDGWVMEGSLDALDAAADALADEIAAKPFGPVRTTKQQVRIAAEALVPTHHTDVDAVLLTGALRDTPAR